MTPSELLKKEADEITARTGRYIPPYRMPSIMAKAQKVTDILIKNDILTSYEECVIILKIALNLVKELKGEE